VHHGDEFGKQFIDETQAADLTNDRAGIDLNVSGTKGEKERESAVRERRRRRGDSISDDSISTFDVAGFIH